MHTLTLNDGNKIPVVGFGVYKIPNDGSTYRAVLEALKVGYRHIDTAMAYYNEEEVGRAVRDSGIPREEIFITSKLWLDHFEYDKAKAGIERSLKLLGTDYMDLYLIHQPYGKVDEAWRAMEEAQAAGLLKSLGVSNMTPKIWQQFVPNFTVKPAVNQIECNPFFQQSEIRQLMEAYDTKVECWGPLGQGNQDLLHHPTIEALAKKYSKDVGQIILRFEVQEGFITLPKSVKPARIKSNLDLFDFELNPDEMESLRAMDTGKGSRNPDDPNRAADLLSRYRIED